MRPRRCRSEGEFAVPEGALPQLELRHDDSEALRQDFEENLRHGRALVSSEAKLAEREACELVVLHPETGSRHTLPAEVVWLQPGGGIGLLLRDFGVNEIARLERFVNTEKKQVKANVHERVRGLSAAEQIRCAREGEIAERAALERVYGKAVWEALLDNPRITAPEVARIARKGNVPKPLLERIVSNPAWLASSELRRALLSNTRLGGAAIDKVLRALPKPELALAARQASYPMPVRQAAKKLRSR
jgi:hypothetical protein